MKHAHAELARIAAFHRGLECGHEGLVSYETKLNHIIAAQLGRGDGEPSDRRFRCTQWHGCQICSPVWIVSCVAAFAPATGLSACRNNVTSRFGFRRPASLLLGPLPLGAARALGHDFSRVPALFEDHEDVFGLRQQLEVGDLPDGSPRSAFESLRRSLLPGV